PCLDRWRAGQYRLFWHDRRRRKESTLALIPGGRLPRYDHECVFGSVTDEPAGPPLPQLAGVLVKARQPDPPVVNEPFDRWIGLHPPPDALRNAFYDDRESRRLMDLDHLPGKTGAQVALRAIHDAQ